MAEENQQEDLEAKVNSFGSKLWGLTKVTATTGTVLALDLPGAIAGFVGFHLSDLMFKGKEYVKEKFTRVAKTTHEANTDTAIAIGYYRTIGSIDSVVGKGAAGLGLLPVFNALYMPTEYIMENYKLGEYLKKAVTHPFKTTKEVYDNVFGNGMWWKATKQTALYLSLPALAVIYLVPAYWQVATGAALAFGYKTIMNLLGKKKKEPAEEKTGKGYTPEAQPMAGPQVRPT